MVRKLDWLFALLLFEKVKRFTGGWGKLRVSAINNVLLHHSRTNCFPISNLYEYFNSRTLTYVFLISTVYYKNVLL